MDRRRATGGGETAEPDQRKSTRGEKQGDLGWGIVSRWRPQLTTFRGEGPKFGRGIPHSGEPASEHGISLGIQGQSELGCQLGRR